MDKKSVKSVLAGLKSTSHLSVLDSLSRIRNKITINNTGLRIFRECNGLDYLVALLQKSNNRILDLALSILGNCCLEDESCILVGNLNVSVTLTSILVHFTLDSILGRTCKLIGNLAQRPSNLENLHNAGIVGAINQLIENRNKNISNPTLSMAVRAIRLLWMQQEKRDEMLDTGIVRTVATLLCAECEAAGIIKKAAHQLEQSEMRPSQEELFSSILKCIGYFTTCNSALCAEQIQGDGRGFQSLVALSKIYEKPALKCLLNLCYVSSCRPLLGTAGFVERLVDILLKTPDVDWWPENATRGLAHLSGEAVNRARLRHCGGLPLLIKAAKQDSHSLTALLQYVFDDTAFQMLINEGLVTFITEELKKHVATMKCCHDYTTKSVDDESKKNQHVETEAEMKSARISSIFQSRTDTNVVIERDNMVVGFVDNLESDGSDRESDSDLETRKAVKRSRSLSPNSSKVIKMANQKWSSSVYWIPMSPNGPTRSSNESRRSTCCSPGSDSDSYGESSAKRARWDWSPDSGIDSIPSPSLSSFLFSPAQSSHNEDSSDSESSGRYSPICSDEEEDVPMSVVDVSSPAAPDGCENVARHLDDLVMHDEADLEDQLSRPETPSASCRASCLLVLLCRVSRCSLGWRDEFGEVLGGFELLNALLDYVRLCARPLGRPASIFTKIFSNVLCLMWLLKHRLAMQLRQIINNSRHPVKECRQCRQLSSFCTRLLSQMGSMAESQYGVGEICYQLLKGSNTMKQTLVLTLPHIVRSDKILKKFFLVCDGLDILLSCVENSDEEVEETVSALSRLASNLHIKDPKTLEHRFKEQISIKYDPILDNRSTDDIVIFKLDDQTTVKADKVFLCQNSDVFHAMLKGKFKESAEKCVQLRRVSKSGLEYLLTLLQYGFNDSDTDLSKFPLAENLETNLEVLLLTDEFLFDKLKELLNSAIQQFLLNPQNAAQIYVWSLNEGMGFLCVESVAYLLTGKMSDTDRINSFRNILSLEYKQQWLDDIKTMILRQFPK